MKRFILIPGIICVLLSACNSKDRAGSNSQNSVNWQGSYSGVLPCADCSGIETRIDLNADETYYISWKYLDSDDAVHQSTGTFRWNANGNRITLDGSGNGEYPATYRVDENQLVQLDTEGNVITGEHSGNYILAKNTGIQRNEYRVPETEDFTVTGDGSNTGNWDRAEWMQLTQRRPAETDSERITRAKVMYSQSGIYCLFDCKDKKITATMQADFMDLWYEDVIEAFFWPDESIPYYFEYEISPLNYELPIMISNHDGELLRWQPFHYEANRHTQHAVAVQGGEQKSGAEISGWTAEFFIPYKLLSPLRNVPPQSGTVWKANFYRMDSDRTDVRGSWSWNLTERSFHDYSMYGTLRFE